jgi:hypothetical protein
MTWTPRTWTCRLHPAFGLGFTHGRQVIADQPAPVRQAGGGDQAAIRSRARAHPPGHPCPPGHPARGRACLSAPLHGTRQTWGKTGARGKSGRPAPGAGEGARA